MSDYEIHPAADLLPRMTDEQFAELKADIEANGQIEKLVLFEGKVLDGRHRLRACEELGIEPLVCEWRDCPDPVSFVVSRNVHRRHLSEAQRAMVAARVKGYYAAEAKKRQGKRNDLADNLQANFPEGSRGQARDAAGAALGVSGKSVDAASKIIAKGAPELQAAVDAGKLAVSTAAKVAELPKRKQREIVKEAGKTDNFKRAVAEQLKPPKPKPTAKDAAERMTAAIETLIGAFPPEEQSAVADQLAGGLLNAFEYAVITTEREPEAMPDMPTARDAAQQLAMLTTAELPEWAFDQADQPTDDGN